MPWILHPSGGLSRTRGKTRGQSDELPRRQNRLQVKARNKNHLLLSLTPPDGVKYSHGVCSPCFFWPKHSPPSFRVRNRQPSQVGFFQLDASASSVGAAGVQRAKSRGVILQKSPTSHKANTSPTRNAKGARHTNILPTPINANKVPKNAK